MDHGRDERCVEMEWCSAARSISTTSSSAAPAELYASRRQNDIISQALWLVLVLGERDMQSMTASAKEDVHEAAVNAY